MIKLIRSIISSPTTASVIKGGYQGVAKTIGQPKLAPVAFGGSLIAGVASMFVGGYKIVDCVRYQSARGQCDTAIESNLPAVVGGVVAITGCWGAFHTYNPDLHQEDRPTEIAPRELVVKDEPTDSRIAPSSSHSPEEVKNLKRRGYTQQQIADELGITIYAVKKLLQQFKAAERGR